MPRERTIDIDELQAHGKAVQKQQLTAVRKMEKYIRKSDGDTLTLEATAKEAGVDPVLFDALKGSLEHTNALLRDGTLKISDIRLETKDDEVEAPKTVDTEGESREAIPTDRGRNHFEAYWWGWRGWLNDRGTHALLSELPKGAAAVSALVIALLPPAGVVLGAVVLALAALYGAFIGFVDAAAGHDGIHFGTTWVGVLWIFGQ